MEAPNKNLAAYKHAVADPSFTTVSAEAGGPPLWHTIHNLARAYKPSTQRELMATWLQTTAALMWCDACAHHFGNIVKTADLSSAAALVEWSVRAHNAVNARLGKPVLSDADAIAAIRAAATPLTSRRSTSASSSLSSWQIATAVLAAAILIVSCVCIWLGVKLHKRAR